MIDHKKCLSKFRKTEIIPSIFSDQQGMKLEISNKAGKFTNSWRFNNMLLNNQCVKEELKWKIKKYCQMKMEAQHIKTYETLQKQF